MELSINIETSEKCSFVLNDSKTGYLEEIQLQSEDFFRFKYSETKSIIATGLLPSEEQDIQYLITYLDHDEQDVEIPTNFDGRFVILYIVLPTKEWVSSNIDNLSNYLSVYFIDGEDVYKYDRGSSKLVDVLEVIEINPDGTTISKLTKECISICFLKKCFISLCKDIFNKRGFSKCDFSGKIDSDLLYKRDLVWMAINIISYLTEFGQLNEAQRIIELITGCNGICKQTNRGVNSNECGCS